MALESQPLSIANVENGDTLYTWVKYANTPTSGMSDDPTGKDYIGLAYNKTTPTESTNYSDYQWSLTKGNQGIPGQPGENGDTLYTWVKYANTPTSGMSDDPSGKYYIGLAYNKLTAVESTNYSDYQWALFKGEQGVPGQPGENGVSVIGVEIGYAQSTSGTITPTTGWQTTPIQPIAGQYIWTRTRNMLSDGTFTNYVYVATFNGRDAVVISETAPTNPVVGTLWQKPSDPTATVLKWNGSAWENWGISVDNIVADNIVAENGVFEKITGLEIEAGTIRNPYNVTYTNNSSAVGELTLDESQIVNRGTLKDSSGQVTNTFVQRIANNYVFMHRLNADGSNNALTVLDFEGTQIQGWGDFYQSASFTKSGIALTDTRSPNFMSELTYHDLVTVNNTLLSPASGWKRYSDDINSANAPVASRNGRMVQLSGAFSPIAQQAAGSTYTIAQTLPIWARPRRQVTVIQQGSGLNRHLIEVSTAGVITVSRYGTSSEVALPANAWINISCVYAGRNLF